MYLGMAMERLGW